MQKKPNDIEAQIKAVIDEEKLGLKAMDFEVKV